MIVASKVTKCLLSKTSDRKSQVGAVILRLIAQLHTCIPNVILPHSTPGHTVSLLLHCCLWPQEKASGGLGEMPSFSQRGTAKPEQKEDILQFPIKATHSFPSQSRQQTALREPHSHIDESAVCVTHGTYLTDILPLRSLILEIKFL